MIRKENNLTEAQREALDALAKTAGKSRSTLIREAINRLIEEHREQRKNEILEQAAGMWKDRDDLPDFRKQRRQWQRDDS